MISSTDYEDESQEVLFYNFIVMGAVSASSGDYKFI